MPPTHAFRLHGPRHDLTRTAALLLGLAAATASIAAEGPRTVSPGGLERSTDAASPCPTFNWSGAAGATGYELVVVALAQGTEPRIVLRESIDGSALGWTPDRSRCLGSDEYAWSVRALATAEASSTTDTAWAPVRRFTVAALPTSAEIEAALETLRHWQAGQTAGSFPGPSGQSAGTFPGKSAGTFPEGAGPAPVTRAAGATVSGTAAIRGEMPGASGETYGVAGVSASPQGAGLAAVNTGGGPDLVLDGAAQGQIDARLFHDALDRPSGNPEAFDFRNSGAGVMTLRVDGVDVVTTVTDQDTLGDLACAPGQIAEVGPGSNWTCAADDDSLAALSCPDGQIAKRVAGAWTCAPDDTGSAGIWSTYPEGADVRVVNQQGNRVAIGNRAMQPVGSAPSEDGALTVSHKAPLPLTTQYNLTLDGQGIQSRLVPGLFQPQQDAPLLLNRYGGSVSIGRDAAPTRAGLEVQGSIGNTMAMFQRSAAGQGVALVGDWPGLYANAYFDNGVRTMSGSGYSGLINFDQTDGAISFMTSDTPNTAPDVPPPSLVESLRLEPSGALRVRSLKSDLAGGLGSAQLGSVSVASLQVADSPAVPDLLVGGTSTFSKDAAFNQDVDVFGTLSKAGGSFRIDHPLDPENRYLLHSFVESPDMMNVYNGNVTLDTEGQAWVELPAWFEALNRDFRYQLTPLGAWSAVWIGREIAANRFQVRGGPGAKVSWQVTGIRHDRWAEAHRIAVEQPKPESERGTYLHPAAWDQPAERGLDHRLGHDAVPFDPTDSLSPNGGSR